MTTNPYIGSCNIQFLKSRSIVYLQYQGKRLFIKDITHYLVPPFGKPATIAPSLGGKTIKKGVGTQNTAAG